MARKAGQTTCTMIFQDDDQSAGWTESFQTDVIDLNNAMSAIQKVANKRVGFLSARFAIKYCRVSAVQAPKVPPARNARVSFLQRTEFGGSLDPQGDGDLPFVAALVRFYNTTKTVFALREFRGVPDSFWSNNDDKTAAASIFAPINRFISSTIDNGMGISHKTAPGVYAVVPIATGEYERMTHRITGRPLYLPRGRSTR